MLQTLIGRAQADKTSADRLVSKLGEEDNTKKKTMAAVNINETAQTRIVRETHRKEMRKGRRILKPRIPTTRKGTAITAIVISDNSLI